MKVYSDLADVPQSFGPSAVAIGKFDGVHAGHLAILSQLDRLAKAHPKPLERVAVTFDRHPKSVLDPKTAPRELMGIDQKIEMLQQAGLDACFVLTFTPEFAATEPEEFVAQVLVNALHASIVLVGDDFRFGRGGTGDVGLLRELGSKHGFSVVVHDEVVRASQRASSTRVRELLAEGDIPAAAEVLGHAPSVRGVVVHGAKRGRELGFPTANLTPELSGFIPSDGVYAGWLIDQGVRYPAAISVGNNPTFEGVPAQQVEAHVLDRTIDLYDHVVDVEFTERLRGQKAYDSLQALVDQIKCDVDQVRSMLVRASADNVAPVNQGSRA